MLFLFLTTTLPDLDDALDPGLEPLLFWGPSQESGGAAPLGCIVAASSPVIPTASRNVELLMSCSVPPGCMASIISALIPSPSKVSLPLSSSEVSGFALPPAEESSDSSFAVAWPSASSSYSGDCNLPRILWGGGLPDFFWKEVLRSDSSPLADTDIDSDSYSDEVSPPPRRDEALREEDRPEKGPPLWSWASLALGSLLVREVSLPVPSSSSSS
mmetsp:Transcript_23789/g.59707  ORF Transcript_23789/g.59707 Transcript_23789/m.59707 type:complete len:215 (+) Transcript_23789:188-832(+)